MCGIYGNISKHRPANTAELRTMGDRLVHRGPDEEGLYTAGSVGLGCRRLSIVDVHNGQQPFRGEDGSVVMVCNGEIFNYPELRARLRGRHTFRSDCDVEIIVHLYEELGIDLVHELNGQFGFALHDRDKGVVYLARDHFGICPLYYRETEDGLRFASEIKAILACDDAPARLDPRGLDQVMCLPALVSPRTMVDGVAAVRPGHYVEVGPGGVREHEYWDLVYPTEDELPPARSLAEDQERVVEALRAAVHRRLRADVPIGLYVSGGLDSALVACLAGEVRDPHVTSLLSVAFDHAELDESHYQRLVADQLGQPHHTVDVGVDDVCRMLEEMVWHAEAPTRESYNVASLRLSALARQEGVKVVLSGEGSDELFAGYSGYRFDALRAEMGVSPTDDAADREALWGDPSYGYDLDFTALRADRERLYSPDLRAELTGFADPVVDGAKLRGRHVMHKRSYLDVKLRLAEHLLGDHGDRMTMANSIEGRFPFLDLDFVRVAMAVAPAHKLFDLEEKYVLKRAAAGIVPGDVADREKFPFTAPASPYLVREAPEFVGDWLAPDVLRRQGLFDVAEVDRMRAAYAHPDYRPSTPLRTDWLMLVLTTTILHDQLGEMRWTPPSRCQSSSRRAAHATATAPPSATTTPR
jgi:asparagine synthase (glutamine-hydrolysing)